MTYAETLVFVGAGASAPFGVPTMRGMVSELQKPGTTIGGPEKSLLDRITRKLGDHYGQSYDLEKLLDVVHNVALGQSTHNALKALSPHALYRYREVLDRIGAGRSEGPERDADEALIGDAQTAANLELQITEQISEWCDRADHTRAAAAYRQLFSEILDGRLARSVELGWGGALARSEGGEVPAITLVTTNYDQCLEHACSRLGAPPEMGFYYDEASRLSEFSIRPEPRRLPKHTMRGPIRNPSNEELVLLKLHGSSNWWRTSDHRVVEYGNGRAGVALPDGERLIRREIRYPVSTKDLVGMPYTALYSWFAEALSVASIWLFIGYSFGDASVVRMMEELRTPRKKLIIVGPSANTIRTTTFKDVSRDHIVPVNVEFGRDYWGPEGMSGSIAAAYRNRNPRV